MKKKISGKLCCVRGQLVLLIIISLEVSCVILHSDGSRRSRCVRRFPDCDFPEAIQPQGVLGDAFIGRFNLRQRSDSSGIGIHIFQDVVHVRCHQCTPGIWVEGFSIPPIGIVLLFILILMVLGCILDSTSILLLTTPLMCPIMADLGYDLVWFGLIMIIAIETGMITPPFGMNVFTVKSSLYGMDGMEGITVNEIFAGSMWFLAAIIIVDLICIFIPQIVLFLPNAM